MTDIPQRRSVDFPQSDALVARLDRIVFMLEALLHHCGLEANAPASSREGSLQPARPTVHPLPKAMGPSDMMKAFGISYPTFNRREKAGDLMPFLLARTIGRNRYFGERVQAFLNGRGVRDIGRR
jgi:hypothetical protein